ncbi:hypothetical protein PR048_029020 [Dryococelus australis]|uniref:Uncharacterized protein n=1 Tax=Dryococelus australis TaxID=614101 RepID=A0ABQ9GC68_9NEOP|nr:hypothetical protein PR048_029020 [Dryococelus australis]
MRMIERRNERVGETGDSRENPWTSGIVRHNSHMPRSGIEPWSPWWELNRLTTQPPWSGTAERHGHQWFASGCRFLHMSQRQEVGRTPPQSPDLKPIENPRDKLNTRVRRTQVSSKELTKLTEEWNDLDQDYTKKIISNMETQWTSVPTSGSEPQDYRLGSSHKLSDVRDPAEAQTVRLHMAREALCSVFEIHVLPRNCSTCVQCAGLRKEHTLHTRVAARAPKDSTKRFQQELFVPRARQHGSNAAAGESGVLRENPPGNKFCHVSLLGLTPPEIELVSPWCMVVVWPLHQRDFLLDARGRLSHIAGEFTNHYGFEVPGCVQGDQGRRATAGGRNGGVVALLDKPINKPRTQVRRNAGTYKGYTVSPIKCLFAPTRKARNWHAVLRIIVLRVLKRRPDWACIGLCNIVVSNNIAESSLEFSKLYDDDEITCVLFQWFARIGDTASPAGRRLPWRFVDICLIHTNIPLTRENAFENSIGLMFRCIPTTSTEFSGVLNWWINRFNRTQPNQ